MQQYRVLYSNAGGEYYTAMQGGYSSIGVLYSNAGGYRSTIQQCRGI